MFCGDLEIKMVNFQLTCMNCGAAQTQTRNLEQDDEGFEAEAAGSRTAILEAVQGARVIVPSVALDLDSLESVRRFAAALRSELGQLDLLAGREGGLAQVRAAGAAEGVAEAARAHVERLLDGGRRRPLRPDCRR